MVGKLYGKIMGFSEPSPLKGRKKAYAIICGGEGGRGST